MRRIYSFIPGRERLASIRSFIRDAAKNSVCNRVDDVTLLADELATNTVDDGATTATVLFECNDNGDLRVSVSDDVPTPPRVGAPNSRQFGMRLVDKLSDQWGVVPRHHGKTVWFEISA